MRSSCTPEMPLGWRRAHDEAWVTYVQRVNATDWESRGYADVVDELDARHLAEMFDRAGVSAPRTDVLSVSRELEREAMARVNARYPDARTAIERLRAAGHKVYVATGGSETNDAPDPTNEGSSVVIDRRTLGTVSYRSCAS